MKKLISLILFIGFVIGLFVFLPKKPYPPEGITEITHYVESLDGHVVRERREGDIVLYKFDKDKFDFSFVNSKEPMRINDWRTELDEPLFIINGTYFNEDFTPSGFLVTDEGEVGTTWFDPDLSGIIDFTDEPVVIDTSNKRYKLKNFTNAAQSFPFYIIDGEIAVKDNKEQLARRSFIGIDTENNIYLGVAYDIKPDLYQMSVALDQMDIDWRHVLNLDGGPSTGMTIQQFTKRGKILDPIILNSTKRVPNVIVVNNK